MTCDCIFDPGLSSHITRFIFAPLTAFSRFVLKTGTTQTSLAAKAATASIDLLRLNAWQEIVVVKGTVEIKGELHAFVQQDNCVSDAAVPCADFRSGSMHRSTSSRRKRKVLACGHGKISRKMLSCTSILAKSSARRHFRKGCGITSMKASNISIS